MDCNLPGGNWGVGNSLNSPFFDTGFEQKSYTDNNDDPQYLFSFCKNLDIDIDIILGRVGFVTKQAGFQQ